MTLEDESFNSRIPHKFTCPDCGEVFSMGVDAYDLEHAKETVNWVKNTVSWGEYLCPECAKKVA